MQTKLTFSEVKRKYEILGSFVDKVLPRKVTTAIARTVAKFEKELEFYDKQRADVVKRYALKNEDGTYIIENNAYTFESKDDEKAFIEEIEQLNSTEVDVEIMRFDVSELERCDIVDKYDKLTAREELALEFIIDYGEGDES